MSDLEKATSNGALVRWKSPLKKPYTEIQTGENSSKQ